MHRQKVRPGHFERMNLRREQIGAALRRRMIEAAMNGGRSGFAVQMRMSPLDPVPLREARPKKLIKVPESWTMERIKQFQERGYDEETGRTAKTS